MGCLTQTQEMDFPELLPYAIDPMFIIKGEHFVDCNDAALAFFKFSSKQQCVNTFPWQVSPTYQPDGQPSSVKAKEKIKACYAKGQQRFLWLHQNIERELLWVEVSIIRIDREGETYIHTTLRDVVEQPSYSIVKEHNGLVSWAETIKPPIKQSQKDHKKVHFQLLKEHKKVIDAASIVSKTDPNGVITYANENFCNVSGYSHAELIGKKHNIVRHPDVDKETYKELWTTINAGKIWQGIIKNKKKNGDCYVVKCTVSPIFDNAGNIIEHIAIRNDITDIYEKEKIIALQNVDTLTQLANSHKLSQDLHENSRCHIALLELPDLRDIQNAYHLTEYNEVISKIAQKITAKLPDNIKLYRCAEHRFALLTSHQTEFNLFVKYCVAIQNFIEANELETQQYSFTLSLNLGMAKWSQGNDIFTQAKMALASGDELNQKLSIFTSTNNIHSRLLATIDWTKKLKSAINSDDIVIFGQQIVDNSAQRYSTEVLMRYFDAHGQRYVSPAEFLAFAKKAKIYTKLSQIVLTKAFEYFANKRQNFSINLSKADISDRFTSRLVLALLEKYQLGKHVTIELVESENYELNDQQFANFLVQLKAYNCQIAIDDFGSGYSNFEYLTRLPVDIIKIDGSLIREIASNEKHQVIVNTIVNFCHSLDIKVVAEYVTDEEVMHCVRNMGVDLFQGYHFHQPEFLS